MDDYPNHKTVPTPPGPPGPDLRNPVSRELAERTWQHAAEHNKEERDKVEKTLRRIEEELNDFRKVQVQLGRRDPENLFPVRSLRESLQLIAELFVNKYPKEDHPVIQNIVEMFVEPVEKTLAGDSDAEPPSDTFDR